MNTNGGENMEEDGYINPKLERIKELLSKPWTKEIEEEVVNILNKIYDDGFTDGTNEGSSEPDVPAWKEDMLSR